jgi:hypothetical protein
MTSTRLALAGVLAACASDYVLARGGYDPSEAIELASRVAEHPGAYVAESSLLPGGPPD